MRGRPGVSLFPAPSPAYPAWLELWLKLEEAVLRPAPRCRRIGGLDLPAAPPRSELTRAWDAVLDLSEQGYCEGAWRLLYDGLPDSLALVGAVAKPAAPLLTIERSATLLASSYAAAGHSGLLSDGLALPFARALSLIERAIDRLAAGTSEESRTPARPAVRPSPLRMVAVGARLATRSIMRRLGGGRGQTQHWTIAWRRTRNGPALPTPEGFTTAAIDPDTAYADPFVITREGETYVFAEVLPYASRKGVIGWARLSDAGLSPFSVALERPYHVSYPFLLEYEGDLYMVPETGHSRAVELYRCVRFPDEWTLERTLMEGVQLKDVTLFEHDGRWWMFAAAPSHGGSSIDELFGWWAPSPFGPWTAHRLNPVKSDVRSARPAGRPIVRDGRLFRPGQDCEAGYGTGLVWCEIVALSPTEFRETPVARWKGADLGPYTGVHTYNGDDCFEVVDLKLTLKR